MRKAKEVDYLAPYLARLGEPSVLTAGDVEQLKSDCLKDLRARLVDLANIIQSRFEMVGTGRVVSRCAVIACVWYALLFETHTLNTHTNVTIQYMFMILDFQLMCTNSLPPSYPPVPLSPSLPPPCHEGDL